MLEHAWRSGYRAALDTMSQDTFDIPSRSKFEWYMEEHYGQDT